MGKELPAGQEKPLASSTWQSSGGPVLTIPWEPGAPPPLNPHTCPHCFLLPDLLILTGFLPCLQSFSQTNNRSQSPCLSPCRPRVWLHKRTEAACARQGRRPAALSTSAPITGLGAWGSFLPLPATPGGAAGSSSELQEAGSLASHGEESGDSTFRSGPGYLFPQLEPSANLPSRVRTALDGNREFSACEDGNVDQWLRG